MKERWKKLLALLLWLLLWQLLSMRVNNPILVAGPAETLQALARITGSTEYWLSLLGTVIRVSGGFTAGGIGGVLLAALAYRFRGLRIFLSPFVASVKAIPVASFVILVLIWAGSSGVAFWVSLIVSFPVLYLNSLHGLMETDVQLIETAWLFRLSVRDSFRVLYFPQLRPFLKSALSITAGMSFKAGVAAEVIGQPLYSIGNGLYRAKIYLETAEVLAWTVSVVLLSLAAEKLILWGMERLEKQDQCDRTERAKR